MSSQRGGCAAGWGPRPALIGWRHGPHRDPCWSAPCRRPIRQRPVEGPPRATGRAGGFRGLLPRHVPSAGAGTLAGPAGARGPHRAVSAAGRLPGGAGQWRHDGVLGGRRFRLGAAAILAPGIRGVLQQVRSGHPECAVAGGASRHRVACLAVTRNRGRSRGWTPTRSPTTRPPPAWPCPSTGCQMRTTAP